MCACPCRGNYPPSPQRKDHSVLIAFLLLHNDEFEQPESMRDGAIIPWNRLACWFGNTDICHVQPVFWIDERDQFGTFSADRERGVHYMERKAFAAKGWKWVQINVTADQERAMYNFLSGEIGKPFATWGSLLAYIWPAPSNGMSWFCSQLTVAALQAGGLLKNWRDAHTVKPHELYEFLAVGFVERPKALLLTNPVQASLIIKATRNASVHHGNAKSIENDV